MPTEILYSGKDCKWGYSASLHDDTIKWFKLLLVDIDDVGLLEDIRECNQIKEAKALLEKHHKSAEEVISDYLRLLWNHSIDSISSDRGGPEYMAHPFRVVLTVPAIWRHKALKKMRKAATDAGILNERSAGKTKLYLISEPEAAALATFADFEKRTDIKV